MRKLAVSLWLLLFLLLTPYPAMGKVDLKVGLVWDLSGQSLIGFEVVQGLYCLEADGKRIDSLLGPGKAYRTGSGPWGLALFENGRPVGFVKNIKLEPVQGKLPVINVYSANSSKQYRGGLEISRQPDGAILAVNSLGEEEYLYGVVPKEMANSWAYLGLEALKAQAVAARTYLYSHNDSKLAKGYSISDSPNIDQAYGGYRAEGAASRAVDATTGELLVDRLTGKTINPSYHSHSGGHTEDSENVWGGQDSHLRGKPDPFSAGQGFFADAWSFTVSAIALGKSVGLGPVAEVSIDKFPSGRVKNVTLTDIGGNSVSKSGRQLAALFYPKDRGITERDFLGSLFSVRVAAGGAAVLVTPDPLKNLLSGQIFRPGPRLDRVDTSVTPPNPVPSPYKVYVFSGSGWGHGVGMSQWGAYGMAKQGYSYRQILEYYYSNTKIVKVPQN